MPWLLRTLALLFVCSTAMPPCTLAQTASSAPASFSLVTDRDPVLTLHGLFHFHPGDNPAWAAPHFDDSPWPLVPGDRSWAESGYKGLRGTAWYRFDLGLPGGKTNFALRMPRVASCYQVFANGELLYTSGKLPPHPKVYQEQPALIPLPSVPGHDPAVLHLAIRIWQSPESARYRSGGITEPIEVGPYDRLHTAFEDARAAQDAAAMALLGLGLLELVASGTSFVLFLFSRSEEEYLWFALLALGLAMRNLTGFWATGRVVQLLPMETLELMGLRLFQVSFLLFLRRLLRADWTFALRTTMGFVFLAVCCDLLWGLPHLIPTTTGNLIDNVFDVPVFAWCLVLVFHRAWQKRPDAALLAVPVTLLILTQQFSAIAVTLTVFAHPSLMEWSETHLTLRHPLQADYTQMAEAIFLLAILAIVVNRFTRTRRDQDRIASELEAAREVQHVLVPETVPATPGLVIATAYHPAQEVGGDFFQILPLPSGATLVVIGDVAGKGMPAALTVSLVVGTLRTLADYTDSPAAILAGLNRRLHGRGTGFTTCLALRFDPPDRQSRRPLTLANAGHLPPYVNGTELFTEPNLPLGLDPDATFAETRQTLHPADHLAVLTDGVPEAMQGRELFGFDRTAGLSRDSAAEIAAAVRRFGQSDDITVLTVDLLPLPVADTVRPSPAWQPA